MQSQPDLQSIPLPGESTVEGHSITDESTVGAGNPLESSTNISDLSTNGNCIDQTVVSVAETEEHSDGDRSNPKSSPLSKIQLLIKQKAEQLKGTPAQESKSSKAKNLSLTFGIGKTKNKPSDKVKFSVIKLDKKVRVFGHDSDDEGTACTATNTSISPSKTKPLYMSMKPLKADTDVAQFSKVNDLKQQELVSTSNINHVFAATSVTKPLISPTTAPVMSPTKPVISPTKPMMSPTKPGLSPAIPMISPTKPVTSPTKPVTSQTNPVISPSTSLVSPTKPVIYPTLPIISAAKPVLSPTETTQFDKTTSRVERPEVILNTQLDKMVASNVRDAVTSHCSSLPKVDISETSQQSTVSISDNSTQSARAIFDNITVQSPVLPSKKVTLPVSFKQSYEADSTMPDEGTSNALNKFVELYSDEDSLEGDDTAFGTSVTPVLSNLVDNEPTEESQPIESCNTSNSLPVVNHAVEHKSAESAQGQVFGLSSEDLVSQSHDVGSSMGCL